MAIQPRFRVYDYFHIYWSNFKILFYACVVEGCSASLTIARGKQTSNLLHLRWSSVENRVSRDVLTGKVYFRIFSFIYVNQKLHTLSRFARLRAVSNLFSSFIHPVDEGVKCITSITLNG